MTTLKRQVNAPVMKWLKGEFSKAIRKNVKCRVYLERIYFIPGVVYEIGATVGHEDDKLYVCWLDIDNNNMVEVCGWGAYDNVVRISILSIADPKFNSMLRESIIKAVDLFWCRDKITSEIITRYKQNMPQVMEGKCPK